MSKFSLRTAAIGVAMSTLLAASFINENITSIANGAVGQAEISTKYKDSNFLNAGVEQYAGWKIFDYKIWNQAGKVVAAAAVAAGAAIGAAAGKELCKDLFGASYRANLLSKIEDPVQKSILLEELN